MKIAVLSGKGGTGKTTVTSNFAVNIKHSIGIDSDVEEPNLHIFMDMKNSASEPVYTLYPSIDKELCNLCGKCGDFCNYHAILPAKNQVIIFRESCHDCGGCKLVCPNGAITYKKREIGKIFKGRSKYNTELHYGLLNIGEMSGVKIIDQLKKYSDLDGKTIFIDSPPGTSCATVAAVEDVDYAVIVSEPTPFGVSDMKMVVEMLREMKIPLGLIINKAGLGDEEIYHYCEDENIEILGEIPFDKKIAELYADGKIFSDSLPEYQDFFSDIYKKIAEGRRSL
ncbi:MULTISPECIES: ATP-binding protein [Psychrilyobacter]|uniref:ATPase n=1 Tax=Psychrilyobacter piezotolerans TaxID=2293438 RepID=A0ABX9KHY1_9FUSO|nr:MULTISPECIES: ATP-binding protein [Psychrilyobacter]MCS5421341.1 ATP-binding protein [Psychrilyobacter sp. S5]NDI77519.1 P-loop NTPase [Psychrilyobacter piezotolerans]RDE62968.1 ATPase [Psychrilyobacter sp. S5]REI41726.1 ATPase [Psychrilyobacter piezotolerans]